MNFAVAAAAIGCTVSKRRIFRVSRRREVKRTSKTSHVQ